MIKDKWPFIIYYKLFGKPFFHKTLNEKLQFLHGFTNNAEVFSALIWHEWGPMTFICIYINICDWLFDTILSNMMCFNTLHSCLFVVSGFIEMPQESGIPATWNMTHKQVPPASFWAEQAHYSSSIFPKVSCCKSVHSPSALLNSAPSIHTITLHSLLSLGFSQDHTMTSNSFN